MALSFSLYSEGAAVDAEVAMVGSSQCRPYYVVVGTHEPMDSLLDVKSEIYTYKKIYN